MSILLWRLTCVWCQIGIYFILPTNGDRELLSLHRLARNVESDELIHISITNGDDASPFQGHDLPNYLDLSIDMEGNGKPKVLRVRRASGSKSRSDSDAEEGIPVYSLGSRGVKKVDVEPIQADVGFYSDVSALNSFRVTRQATNNTAYNIEGAMVVDGREYVLSPDNVMLETGSSPRAYRLCKLFKRFDFGNDQLFTAIQDDTPTMNTKRRRSRNKRQAMTYNVEIGLYCDYTCYRHFATIYSREGAMSAIQRYYAFTIHTLNTRFSSIARYRSDSRIQVFGSKIVVVTDPRQSSFTEDQKVGRDRVSALGSIRAFKSYIKKSEKDPLDHWMLFTGYDLVTDGSNSTIGIAYTRGICTSKSVSVIEEFFSGATAHVATHELGHSLGSGHDGEYSRCRDSDFHVMSGVSYFPKEGSKLPNPWLFSFCSSNAIADFVQEDQASCLINVPDRGSMRPQIDPRDGVLPGQQQDADAQCRQVQGPQSYFCRGVQLKEGYDVFCVRMYCFMPLESPNCGPLIAMDGTSCGDGKFCDRGRCMQSSAAPRKIGGDTCPQGDDKSANCQLARCTGDSEKDIFCCETCARLRRQQTAPSSLNADKAPAQGPTPRPRAVNPPSRPRSTPPSRTPPPPSQQRSPPSPPRASPPSPTPRVNPPPPPPQRIPPLPPSSPRRVNPTPPLAPPQRSPAPPPRTPSSASNRFTRTPSPPPASSRRATPSPLPPIRNSAPPARQPNPPPPSPPRRAPQTPSPQRRLPSPSPPSRNPPAPLLRPPSNFPLPTPRPVANRPNFAPQRPTPSPSSSLRCYTLRCRCFVRRQLDACLGLFYGR